MKSRPWLCLVTTIKPHIKDLIFTMFIEQIYIFNKPSVAAAVLLTSQLVLDSFIHELILFLQIFKASVHLKPQEGSS